MPPVNAQTHRSRLRAFILASLLLHAVAMVVVKWDEIADAAREIPVVREALEWVAPRPPAPTPEELAEESQEQQLALREQLEQQMRESLEQQLQEARVAAEIARIAEQRVMPEQVEQKAEQLREAIREQTMERLASELNRHVEQRLAPMDVAATDRPATDPARKQAEILAEEMRDLTAEEELRRATETRLRQTFDELIADTLPPDLKNMVWKDIVKSAMSERLEAYARQARDERTSQAERDAARQELQLEFVQSVPEALERAIAEQAVAELESTLAPELVKEFEKHLDARPGASLDKLADTLLAERRREDEAAAVIAEGETSAPLAELENALARLAEDDLAGALQDAFDRDFDEHGREAQLKRIEPLFHQAAWRKGLRSTSLRLAFRDAAAIMLDEEVSDMTQVADTGTARLRETLKEQRGEGVPPPATEADEARQDEIMAEAAPVIAQTMAKLTTAAVNRATQDTMKQALDELFGGAEVTALHEALQHATQTLRGDTMATSSAQEPFDPLRIDLRERDETPPETQAWNLAARQAEYFELVDILDERLTETVLEVRQDSMEGVGPETPGDAPASVRTVAGRILLPRDKVDADEPVDDRTPYKPLFETRMFGFAPRLAPGAITLDGDLSDWKDIPANPLRKADEQGRPNFRVAWDSVGIYVAIEALDEPNSIQRGDMNIWWRGDSVEVWFDLLNRKHRMREADDQTHQFAFWPFGSRIPNVHGLEIGPRPAPPWVKRVTAEDIPVASRQTEFGWTLELFFPRERLFDPKLQIGRFIGMDVSVSNGRGTTYWSGGYSTTFHVPGAWGDILLSGSDAQVEIFPENRREDETENDSPTHFWPGDRLIVRVTDPDRNLDPDVRETVRVALETSSGGRGTLVLTEPEPDSGMFEGTIQTGLAIGEERDGVLECHDGDTVQAIYSDAFRVLGPRLLEAKAAIGAAAAIVGGK